MSEASIDESPFRFEHRGYCPACDNPSVFRADGPYFRRTLTCSECDSRPRHRALMHVISRFAPDWKQKVIHESSPGWDIVSARLSRANRYIPTQNDTSVPFGTEVVNARMPFGGYRSEDLEAQTFLDEAFDLVITQDVFEHLFNPNKAIQEIERTLKPGGVIIMTVPIVRKNRPSRRRAALNDGQVDHLLPPEYHGNPLGEGGSLVTMDWGYDIASILQGASGLSFLMLQIDNIDLGIRADFNEVLCGFKKPFTAES